MSVCIAGSTGSGKTTIMAWLLSTVPNKDVYKRQVTAPPAEHAPPSNEPVPGSSNGNGAVYDPVFGWVVPGNVQQRSCMMRLRKK